MTCQPRAFLQLCGSKSSKIHSKQMKERDLKFAQYLFSYDRFVNPEPQMHLMMLNYVGFKTYELLMLINDR